MKGYTPFLSLTKSAMGLVSSISSPSMRMHAFGKYPSYESGYLMLEEKGKINMRRLTRP